MRPFLKQPNVANVVTEPVKEVASTPVVIDSPPVVVETPAVTAVDPNEKLDKLLAVYSTAEEINGAPLNDEMKLLLLVRLEELNPSAVVEKAIEDATTTSPAKTVADVTVNEPDNVVVLHTAPQSVAETKKQVTLAEAVEIMSSGTTTLKDMIGYDADAILTCTGIPQAEWPAVFVLKIGSSAYSAPDNSEMCNIHIILLGQSDEIIIPAPMSSKLKDLQNEAFFVNAEDNSVVAYIEPVEDLTAETAVQSLIHLAGSELPSTTDIAITTTDLAGYMAEYPDYSKESILNAIKEYCKAYVALTIKSVQYNTFDRAFIITFDSPKTK